MPIFQSINDVQTAVLAAQNAYANAAQPGNVQVNLGATDTVLYNSVQGRDDFGLPAIWEFTGNVQALRAWWLGLHQNSGVFLPRQYKHGLGVYQVNLQYQQVGKPLFNYHVTVP